MSASQTLQKHDALAPTTLRRRPSAVLRARNDRDETFDGLVRDLRVAAKALAAAS
jgi:hypothetical protein